MKLLNRTIRSYLFYSVAIVLIAIPLFYFTVRKVLLRSVDHSLRMQMRDIRSNLSSIHSPEEIMIWSKMDKDIQLAPSESSFPDRIYTVYRKDPRHHDEDPYREIRGSIMVNGNNYSLIISSSLVENEDLLGSILLVQAILLLLLLAGMIWINRNISKKIWKPFHRALETMKKYELQKHEALNLEPTNIDEFNELNGAIKSLTDSNQQVYLKQKEFTDNASHEMQTPLAIFQGKIELLMQTEPLTEDQASLISSLEENNVRMAKLHKSLLLLSKIENNHFLQKETIDLNALLHKTVEQTRENADFRDIKIVEDYTEPCKLEANPTLIEVLVSNLINNAIRHNIEQGEIKIKASNRMLLVSNTGSPDPLPQEKIFDRFYKTGKFSGSVGLGLSIVREICDLYHYSIEYRFEQGHHQFIVVFDR